MAEESQPNPEKTPEIGPARIGLTTFVFKMLAAAAGGVAGTLILMGILVVASSILTPLTNAAQDAKSIGPIFVFILMMMIFLSSTASNILSTWLLSLTEREKYTRISSAIYQVFIVSVLIFLLMAPIYFLTANLDITLTTYAIGLHIIISAQISALILEIIANPRYSLIGAYAVTFSIIISAAVIFLISSIIPSSTILLFAALPIVWGSIALTYSIVTMVYGFIARTYDKDFLATDTDYGEDYGKSTEEVKKQEAPKAKDEAGADFLRHN